MDGMVGKNGRPNEANLSRLGNVNLITLDSVDISGQLKSVISVSAKVMVHGSQEIW